ncbi:MAG: hypothetical protein LBS69_08760 [Prevotellaceae bacterium]|nr:hypothetical protein [Prevotellaceae bacterium]
MYFNNVSENFLAFYVVDTYNINMASPCNTPPHWTWRQCDVDTCDISMASICDDGSCR